MTASPLSSADRSLLLVCRKVAEENHIFYVTIYESMKNEAAKTVLGQAMAAKKAFIDAIGAIDLALDIEGGGCNDNDISSRLEADFPPENGDPNQVRDQGFWTMVSAHEERFNDALDMALQGIADSTTRDVIEHHKHAGSIARKAVTETDI